MINDVSIKSFGKAIKLEESIQEWQKNYKSDTEMNTVL